MTYEKITDHADQAVARLPGYQQSATNYLKLLNALNTEVQALEDVLWQLSEERHLSVAVGTQLDNLGTILNVPRQGLDDDNYRIVIAGAAAALGQSGEAEALIAAYGRVWLGIATVTANSIHLEELTHAAVRITAEIDGGSVPSGSFAFSDYADVDGSGSGPTGTGLGFGDGTFWWLLPVSDLQEAQAVYAMSLVKAAGVRLHLIINDITNGRTLFAFGDAADADVNEDMPTSTMTGLGDTSDTSGGQLSRLLTM